MPSDISAQDLSPQEIMAVFLARDLKDREHLMVGVAMPIVEAAVRLAHLLHGPNMELIFFGTRMNVADRYTLPLPAFAWDSRVVRWAESFSDTGHRFEDIKHWHKRVFFIGGVQVDPHGNTNLIGVGPDYATLRFRGPGSVGTPTLSTHVGRYYIVLNSHSPRILVERCDYMSTCGWGDGGADARKKLGLPGGGPKYCVTPLCVMDFGEEDKHMRLHSVHPGVTPEAVQAQTGFALKIPDQVPTTPYTNPGRVARAAYPGRSRRPFEEDVEERATTGGCPSPLLSLLLGKGRGEGSLHKSNPTAPWGGRTLFCTTGFKQAGHLFFSNNERRGGSERDTAGLPTRRAAVRIDMFQASRTSTVALGVVSDDPKRQQDQGADLLRLYRLTYRLGHPRPNHLDSVILFF